MGQGFGIETKAGLNVVAIGGGNGLSTLLSGLKNFAGQQPENGISISRLSAIVAVTDDGGSSGRLRDELQMLPPGDIRNCMVALSEDSLLLSRLFRHRFPGNGALGGHSFGNIFLAALTDLTGDFAEAVRLSSEILASKGHIYPATTADVHLAAELEDGSVVRGETNISKIGPSIRRLFLEPETCHPMPEAIAAIEAADLITIGPGSLFTSILPPLLVHGVSEAVARSLATRVFVSNLMTQPGETDGFPVERHLEAVEQFAPEIDFDHIVVNSEPISVLQREKYAEEHAEQIGVGESGRLADAYGANVVYANLLDDGEMVRHNPERLANAVLSCTAAEAKVG
jgi:uncharacterized cofD-like protein